jgi:hypothetical protein
MAEHSNRLAGRTLTTWYLYHLKLPGSRIPLEKLQMEVGITACVNLAAD